MFCSVSSETQYLADCLEMSCTLVRGDYNRAWNEVDIFPENPNGQNCSQPRRYIVDLMHEPGALLEVSTPAAVQYQTIWAVLVRNTSFCGKALNETYYYITSWLFSRTLGTQLQKLQWLCNKEQVLKSCVYENILNFNSF